MKYIHLLQRQYMKPKTIIISILLALLAIVLFNNKEEATFWLFGENRASKLIILGIFFLLGLMTGAVLFRRKNRHPKEYTVSGNPMQTENDTFSTDTDRSSLSDSDRDYLSRD